MPSPSRRFRVLFVLLLTLIVLVSPGAWAGGGRPDRNESPANVSKPSPDLLSRAWSFLTLWVKEGCNVDPDGRCVIRPAPVPTGTMQTETGCNVDPDGRCRS